MAVKSVETVAEPTSPSMSTEQLVEIMQGLREELRRRSDIKRRSEAARKRRACFRCGSESHGVRWCPYGQITCQLKPPPELFRVAEVADCGGVGQGMAGLPVGQLSGGARDNEGSRVMGWGQPRWIDDRGHGQE